jgi:hypothetical protein
MKTLMYVCPYIIYENDERYQLVATILFMIITNSNLYTPEDGHIDARNM